MISRHQTVLLVGPPGAGKGTAGRVLGSIPGFYHCACGDVFRRLDPTSNLGRTFIEFSSRGELVPDDLTVKMWHAHIRKVEALGAYKPKQDLLVLDGIPRTVGQAEELEQEIRVLKVISLVCPDESAMIDRLRRRAIKENRFDDAREDVIRHRWEVYQEETAPVLEHFAGERVIEVDAMKSPAAVLRDILDIVIPIQNELFKRLEDESNQPA